MIINARGKRTVFRFAYGALVPFYKGINMKMDISEIILIANGACTKLKVLSANAGNIDLDGIATQNEILLYCYESLKLWITEQNNQL